MPPEIKIDALQAMPKGGKLNEEWIALSNVGDAPFNTEGCSISVARSEKSRPRVVTTVKAGLVIQPGEKVRLVSGSSGKKSHGEAPDEEGCKNVHLFLKAPFLDKKGLTVRLTNKQREICRTNYPMEAAAE